MNDREILKPLVDKILQHAAMPVQADRKELWAKHQSLQKAGKIPVCVFYEGIPLETWDLMFGENHMKCASDTGREIEFFLKRVLWMAENVPDDHIVWPMVKVRVPYHTKQDWGVETEMVAAEETLGAKAFASPLKDGIDISKLRKPVHITDDQAWARKKEEVAALTGGRLAIYPYFWNMEHSPFDVAANMRGLENLMYDPMDNPEGLHALMDFLVSAYVEHHLDREKHGWINFMTDATGKYQPVLEFRIHCAFTPEEARKNPEPRLKYEWAYVSAQTSSGFGPDMYAEFVHRYNERLAALFPLKTVYYHGCEPLDMKAETIMTLPNLRRFHVSPWSSLPKIAEVVKGRAVMEVHSHPSKVLFGWSEKEIRAEIRRLIDEAHGLPMDLNLSDIHSVNNRPETLALWAKVAQE
jgi:hypothetical protein